MSRTLLYPAGSTDAVHIAAKKLALPVIDHPTPEVTHVLLDVPGFRSDGMLRNGDSPERVLERLPENVTVIGGNLIHTALGDRKTIDLLRDEIYLARNAAITARCAIRLALPYLGITLLGCPVLIIGYGRIGKSLALLLKSLGAEVTVAARKASDRAMIEALGLHAASTDALNTTVGKFRLIYNTVPAPILGKDAPYRPDCIAIELASKPGIAGRVIDGRGLPGKLAPESSGALIAETITRLIKEDLV